jgi:hypothetical protein
MGYNDSRTGYAMVTSIWRVFVPSERAWNRTIKELPALLKPPRESLYRPRVAGQTGHQIDLMHWHLSSAEGPAPSCYPDW